MVRPTQEAVETFMRITGASESFALRKLEEYRGNISAAVNAHFSEAYNYNPYYAPTIPQHNYATVNDESHGGQRGLLPLVNAARSFRPSLLLDPNYRRHLYNQISRSSLIGPPPSISQPGGMGPAPPEFNSLPAQPPHLAHRPTYEDENHPSSSSNLGNHIEDEMIKAAIEASKQDSSDLELLQRQLQQEDDDIARAISLSLKMTEQEEASRELQVENEDEELSSRIGRRDPSSSESQEMGRILAAQEASFPPEPGVNDKDTVTLLLRMPDGSRHECRFLKSDKLQLLFNFINDKVAMKPGTYRVVTPYPRCAFGVDDGSMLLRELGLTGKQEALFLELI